MADDLADAVGTFYEEWIALQGNAPESGALVIAAAINAAGLRISDALDNQANQLQALVLELRERN